MHRQLKSHYKNVCLRMYIMFQRRPKMLNRLGRFAFESPIFKILICLGEQGHLNFYIIEFMLDTAIN